MIEYRLFVYLECVLTCDVQYVRCFRWMMETDQDNRITLNWIKMTDLVTVNGLNPCYVVNTLWQEVIFGPFRLVLCASTLSSLLCVLSRTAANVVHKAYMYVNAPPRPPPPPPPPDII